MLHVWVTQYDSNWIILEYQSEWDEGSNFQNVERRLFSVLLEKDKEKIFELEKSHDWAWF